MTGLAREHALSDPRTQLRKSQKPAGSVPTWYFRYAPKFPTQPGLWAKTTTQAPTCPSFPNTQCKRLCELRQRTSGDVPQGELEAGRGQHQAHTCLPHFMSRQALASPASTSRQSKSASAACLLCQGLGSSLFTAPTAATWGDSMCTPLPDLSATTVWTPQISYLHSLKTQEGKSLSQGHTNFKLEVGVWEQKKSLHQLSPSSIKTSKQGTRSYGVFKQKPRLSGCMDLAP